MQSLRDRTQQVDRLIASQWPDLSRVALVAVGGYGRSELFPHSDIDLLIVTGRADLQASLAPFIRGLWDSGLRVSQSVHTPEECVAVDDRNIELSVSLLDRRFLRGDAGLFEKLRDPPKDSLMPALARLTRERHSKYANTIYHLEPDIKHAPGVMRDLQVMRWLAQLDGTAASPVDCELLFRIRHVLHELARRDQNILNFQMQDECAERLGFAGAPQLMSAYYRDAAALFRLCTRRLDQVESRRSPLFAALRDRASRLSTSEFSVINGHVYLRAGLMTAPLFVRLFEFVARHGLPLAADTEDRVRKSSEAAAHWPELREIFCLPHAAMAARAMQNTGWFIRRFPDLKALESLAIRDFYHRYTVDEHTLVAMESAAKLREAPDAFGELARETPDYALLFLSLLFHDSGKAASSENHAEASVEIAARACAAIHVSARETEIVLYLIAAHLEMSRLMLKRDLSDPGTAALLAGSVKTVERLKLLTLLTFCDISAVNPEALTPWRATLLWRLYLVTARYLTRALQTDTAEEGMPARYAFTHSSEEIAEHHRMEADCRLTKLERTEGAYRLTVVSPDRPALFARIAGALAGFGMNILRAESFTNERRTAVQTFCFADPARTLELNPSEAARLEQTVSSSVNGERDARDFLRARPGARRASASARAVQVSFDCAASPTATLFEITAEDRPGLLFDLTLAIASADCNIEVVLIDTEGRKAIDVFYLTRHGQPLPEEAANELSEALRTAAA